MIGGGKWETQDKILDGTYINFVSDNDDDDSSATTSVLGIAIIGLMILGEGG